MATGMVKKAWATTVVAAGLVAGIALGGNTGAWGDTRGASGVPQAPSMGAWAEEDGFDPDPPRGRPWTSEATPAVVAIDVVANYCSPTPCRPR